MDDVKIINDRLIASCRNASSDCGRVLHEYGINKITATFSGSGRAEDEDACNSSYEMGSWTAPWRLCKEGRILLASGDGHSEVDYNEKLKSLKAERFIELSMPTQLDVRIRLTDGYVLDFLTANSDDDESFHIFTPDGAVIAFSQRFGWQIGQADKPWRPEYVQSIPEISKATCRMKIRHRIIAWLTLPSRPVIGNRILWQGREYSWATGLYYFRSRWYDPDTGRWLSKDQIGISGGFNLYEYCGGDPVNNRDPRGEAVEVSVAGVRGAVILGGQIGVSLVFDGNGSVGIKIKSGISTGVEVGVDGWWNAIGKYFAPGMGISDGNVVFDSGIGIEGHGGVLFGMSFDPVSNSVINGIEVGGIGGGVYATGWVILPVFNPQWFDRVYQLFSNKPDERK